MEPQDEVLRTLEQCVSEGTILRVETRELQLGDNNRAIYVTHDDATVTIGTHAKEPIALALTHITSLTIERR